MTSLANRHAVVLGVGMAGLLAARVLSESFGRVTLIDRDSLPAAPDERRGVPQGRHVHGFQARGVEILRELFPGLVDELIDAGASRVDDLSRLQFSVGGHRLTQQRQPIAPILLATRPFLEYRVRQRVEALDGVDVLCRLDVTGLHYTGTPGNQAVTGVRVTPSGGGAEDVIAADLVVDATGRGSRAPVWLEELGYERPAEERIKVRIKYLSQLVRLPSRPYPMRFLIEGRSPGRSLGVALFGCEHDTWVFTVLGAESAFGPDTREWMLDVADRTAPAWASEALRAAEPLTPVSTHRHPASVRRRYDLLTRFPSGFVVLGDAMCAFNPTYGTGMSVAAEQALGFRTALAGGADGLALRFFRASAKPIAAAWDLAAGADLSFPETEGEPNLPMRVIGRYLNRVLGVAERDPEVARRFLAVAGLVAPRTAVFSPRILGPVLWSAITGGPRTAGTEPRTRPADEEIAVGAR